MGEVRRQPSPFQEPRALLELSELDISPAPAAGRAASAAAADSAGAG